MSSLVVCTAVCGVHTAHTAVCESGYEQPKQPQQPGCEYDEQSGIQQSGVGMSSLAISSLGVRMSSLVCTAVWEWVCAEAL